MAGTASLTVYMQRKVPRLLIKVIRLHLLPLDTVFMRLMSFPPFWFALSDPKIFLYSTLDTMYICYQTCIPHLWCSHSAPCPFADSGIIPPQILVAILTCGESHHRYLWWFGLVAKTATSICGVLTCSENHHKYMWWFALVVKSATSICGVLTCGENQYKYMWCFALVVKSATEITTKGENHHICFSQCPMGLIWIVIWCLLEACRI